MDILTSAPKLNVINLFGGPSAGKSTMALGMASELKLRRISAELVTEVAKDMVWDEAFTLLRDQVMVAALQYHRLWRLQGKVDVAITDSPIILSKIDNRHALKTFDPFIDELFGEFRNINLFVERPVVHEYDKIGRIHDELEAIEIDKQIKRMLKDNGIPFETVPCSKESIEEVLTYYGIGAEERWQVRATESGEDQQCSL